MINTFLNNYGLLPKDDAKLSIYSLYHSPNVISQTPTKRSLEYYNKPLFIIINLL